MLLCTCTLSLRILSKIKCVHDHLQAPSNMAQLYLKYSRLSRQCNIRGLALTIQAAKLMHQCLQPLQGSSSPSQAIQSLLQNLHGHMQGSSLCRSLRCICSISRTGSPCPMAHTPSQTQGTPQQTPSNPNSPVRMRHPAVPCSQPRPPCLKSPPRASLPRPLPLLQPACCQKRWCSKCVVRPGSARRKLC